MSYTVVNATQLKCFCLQIKCADMITGRFIVLHGKIYSLSFSIMRTNQTYFFTKHQQLTKNLFG